MKPLLVVSGPVSTRSGYGSHTRDLVRSLVDMDKFDIHINSLKWGNCPMNALNEEDPNDNSQIPSLTRDENYQKQIDEMVSTFETNSNEI